MDTEHGYVHLILEQDAFRIEDSGEGIPAQAQEDIFKPFVRGEHVRGEGLGLGLLLVKRICIHQGWRITVSEQPFRGSCFRVTLNGSDLVGQPVAFPMAERGSA